DEALHLSNRELTGYAMTGLTRRQLVALITQQRLRIQRAGADELAAVIRSVAIWRPRALEAHQPELARQLDATAAIAQFALGNVAAAHAAELAAWGGPAAGSCSGGRGVH